MVSCSFCGKNQDECLNVIAGPADVYICDECVRLCNEIIHKELAKNIRETKQKNDRLNIANRIIAKHAFSEIWGTDS